MSWLRPFLPALLPTPYHEQLRASLGALIGILLTGAISTWWLGSTSELPALIAPMGASAVLLFGVLASSLAALPG